MLPRILGQQVYWSIALVLWVAAPASAADLPTFERAYHQGDRSRPVQRVRVPTRFRVAECPRGEPADYRPRLIGEPDCQAARPYGLSATLYGPRIGTEWGVDY